ncbi:MAG: hypothetical protein ACKOC6_02445, partial [bacterium]
ASEGVLAAHGTVLARDGARVRMRVADEAALPRLTTALVTAGARLYALPPLRRSLESTFLEVMGDDGRPG